MGLLSPKPKTPRPQSRPRVYLSKEDRREVNALRPIERQLGFATAAYALLAIAAITAYSKNGFGGTTWWRFPLAVAFCAVLAVMAWKTNRWLTGIGAVLVVYGLPWGRWVLVAFPVLAFFVWLNIRIFKDQRKRMDERAEAGDFGVDPRNVPRGRKKVEAKATTDATGRALPSASKRYTPPKSKKKR